jgi:hypothetical protein
LDFSEIYFSLKSNTGRQFEYLDVGIPSDVIAIAVTVLDLTFANRSYIYAGSARQYLTGVGSEAKTIISRFGKIPIQESILINIVHVDKASIFRFYPHRWMRDYSLKIEGAFSPGVQDDERLARIEQKVDHIIEYGL